MHHRLLINVAFPLVVLQWSNFAEQSHLYIYIGCQSKRISDVGCIIWEIKVRVLWMSKLVYIGRRVYYERSKSEVEFGCQSYRISDIFESQC